MKRFLVAILLSVAVSFASDARISFASWNIRWQSPEDVEKGNAWSKRFEPIADVIKFYDFDIICIQESSTNREQDLMPLLQDYVFKNTLIYSRNKRTSY